jgi:uncharacterized metal-binding protein
MKIQKKECGCGKAPKLIFPCSGAADTGEIADRAARRLSAARIGRMSCLAGLGGKIDDIIETVQMALSVLAIDGCPTDCARKTLENAGITGFLHLRITDMGMEKGHSPVSNEKVIRVAEKGAELLESSGGQI